MNNFSVDLFGDENIPPDHLSSSSVSPSKGPNCGQKSALKVNNSQPLCLSSEKNSQVKFETPLRIPDAKNTPEDSLDDEENWRDRTEVVTKLDHQENETAAQGIVDSVVDNLPLSQANSPAAYAPQVEGFAISRDLLTGDEEVLKLSSDLDQLIQSNSPALPSSDPLDSLLDSFSKEGGETIASPELLKTSPLPTSYADNFLSSSPPPLDSIPVSEDEGDNFRSVALEEGGEENLSPQKPLSPVHTAAAAVLPNTEAELTAEVAEASHIADSIEAVTAPPKITEQPAVVEPVREQPPVAVEQPPVEPVQSPVEPVQSPVESVQPPVESVQPQVEPEQPPVKPVQPPVEPVQPSVEPEQPPVEPEQPSVEPEQPPVETEQPPVEPVQPPVEPVQPSVEPVQPSGETEQPSVEPEQPPVAAAPAAKEPATKSPFKEIVKSSPEQKALVDLPPLFADMEAKEDAPPSPEIPIPKAAYNIDWDNFDDSVNPFQTSKQLGNSPPVGEFPMKKPPLPAGEANPFKTKAKMANSPPPSPKVTHCADVNENVVNEDSKPLDNNNVKESTAPPPKATAPPKKKPGMGGKQSKRTGGPARFKPPAHFTKQKQAQSEEIEIFAPPPPRTQPSPVEAEEKKTAPVSNGDIIRNEVAMPSPPAAAAVVPAPAPAKEEEVLPPPPPPASSDDVEEAMETSAMEFDDDQFQPAGKVFSDPAAWDMFEKTVATGNAEEDSPESLLARQSLYVKFDPLVKGPGLAVASSVHPPPNISEVPTDLSSEESSLPVSTAASAVAAEHDLMLMNTPPVKQAQQHPAARALKEKVKSEQSEPRDVDDILACSPMASTHEADQAHSPRSSPTRHVYPDVTLTGSNDIVEVLKYSEIELKKKLVEMEQVLKGEMMRQEQKYVKKLKDEQQDKESLQNQIDKLTTSHEQMKTVVMEYEKTVTMLVAEKENSSCANTDSLSELARERDQALEDLQSVETAFSDLHRRFEKSKSTVEAFKKNEETLKKCVSDYQTKLKKQEEKYQSLKHLAEDRLSTSHEAFENYKRSTKGDITRLELALRKAELEVKTLQQTVEQKTNENAELTNICDELLNKVGSE